MTTAQTAPTTGNPHGDDDAPVDITLVVDDAEQITLTED